MTRLLIVVDYQTDFVDGTLGFPGAEKLAAPIAEKIAAYHANQDEVVFTFDTHEENYLTTQEGRNLPVEHCLRGSTGHSLYGVVAEAKQDCDQAFYKPTFASEELFDWLRERQQIARCAGGQPFESIELVGLVSNICVISNAVLVKTACPEVPIVVDAACTASYDEIGHKAALAVMESLQIKVINRS